MYIKDIGHPDELLGIIGEEPSPLSLLRVEYLIIYCKCVKGNIFNFSGGIYMLLYLLSSVPHYIGFPKIICKFPMAVDLVKIPHLGSIIIYIV